MGPMNKPERGDLLYFNNNLSKYDLFDINLKYLKGSKEIHNEDKNQCDKDLHE